LSSATELSGLWLADGKNKLKGYLSAYARGQHHPEKALITKLSQSHLWKLDSTDLQILSNLREAYGPARFSHLPVKIRGLQNVGLDSKPHDLKVSEDAKIFVKIKKLFSSQFNSALPERCR